MKHLPIIFALMLILAGCDKPINYAHPHMLWHSGKLLVSVQVVSFDMQGTEHLFLSSADEALSEWEISDRYRGRIIQVMSEDEKICLVFSDGTVAHRADGETQSVSRSKQKLNLLSAGTVGKTIVAVNYHQDSLQLMAFTGTGWTPYGPALPVTGNIWIAALTSLGGKTVLLWRTRAGGAHEPGLNIARLDAEVWHNLPQPPLAFKGPFAVLTTDTELLLLREREDGVVVSRFDGTAWSGRIGELPLPPELMRVTGMGLDITVHNGRLFAVRADGAGVHIFSCPDLSAKNWQMTATPMQQERAEIWGIAQLLLILFFGLLLLIGTRMMLRVTEDTHPDSARKNIGGLATPMDRALALTVDSLLLLPFMATYHYYGSDYNLLQLPKHEHVLYFWIYLAAISAYCAICESLWGATLGKRIFNIRIRNVSGGTPTTGQVLTRNLFRLVDFFPVSIFMPYLIALVSISFSRRRQRVGDRIAKTMVLRHTPLERRSIVLASRSPRRKELLSALGLEFREMAPDIDESGISGATVQETVMLIAQKKAEAAVGEENDLIIAADTIVVLDDEILGKPRDRDEAREMLTKLSANRHRVLTGVAIIDNATGQHMAACEETEVQFLPLSPDEINEYVDTGEADDKAGAYGIQGSADRFVESLRGSLSNVIGLPMELLQHMLKNVDG